MNIDFTIMCHTPTAQSDQEATANKGLIQKKSTFSFAVGKFKITTYCERVYRNIIYGIPMRYLYILKTYLPSLRYESETLRTGQVKTFCTEMNN